MIRRLAILVLAACALAAALAGEASAHARLVDSVPARDAVAKTQPKTVQFRFDESVEGKFGAVKVFDVAARRVDDGDTKHPGGQGKVLQTGLKPNLPDGTYTATYRVVSADGHPVEGGLVFSIGKAGASTSKTIDELIGTAKAGPATKVPFGIARSIDYLATALAIGLLAFLLWCWRRGLAEVAGAGAEWRTASEALAARARRILFAVVLLGLVSTALGIVFQGAVAAGTTFWGALDGTILRDVISTRFGTVWALKAGVWAALGAALVVVAPRHAFALRPAALGADGQVLGAPGTARLVALIVPATALAFAPAFAGHATTQDEPLLLIPADVVHVLAMSLWFGGLAGLLLLVPRATAALEPVDRTRLLAAVLVRFSPLALACVLALSITGTLQSIVYLQSFGDFLDDAFGRAVLIKIGLILALIGMGATNRQRVLPQLRQLASGGGTPGAAGHLLRRTLRLEVGTVLVVLAVTGALVGYAPPSSTAGVTGPVNISERLGPLQLEATIEPARVGANTMHLYLFAAKGGRPFDGTQEITVTATQKKSGVGPIAVSMQKTGPGHYTADRFQLVPGGTWTFDVVDRVSEFDQYETSFTAEVGR
ncbi:Copper transport protein YcnJ [Paraconexibacter sp. AEG42_29]|uniref:Copper transport protein YcnJ n=1 Tax=Paraconexibacter sp. AEG42_29 TaxID=2997339 RepID=A0AAU7APW4_9ACTN